MLDALPFKGKLVGEFLVGVDTVVGLNTVVVALGVDLDSGGCGLRFKTELGLNGLSPSEADLVHNGELALQKMVPPQNF
jgi:hypothetical protein